VSLSRKTSRTLYISQRYEKNWCSADTVELGKGNSEKMCLLSRRLKVPSVCDAVTLDGKLFQTRGAATKKKSYEVKTYEHLINVKQAPVALGMLLRSKS